MFIYELKLRNEVIPGYRMNEKSEILSLKSNKIIKSFPNKEGKRVVWLNIDGKDKMCRLDYLVLSTHNRFYDDAIRVVHIDDDDDNCNINNLMVLRKVDIINKYKEMYHVENLEDIEEEWKTYSLLPLFEISNFGNVRDKDTKVPILNVHDSHGYKFICSNGTYYFIHRLVAELFVENPKPDKFFYVNHIDGDKSNNKFYNLEWCNISINTEHAFLTGLQRSYDEKTIHDVCELLALGMPHTDISMITGVNRKYISDIYTGRRHKDISSKYKFIKKLSLSELYNDDAIEALMLSGYKPKEIASILRIPYTRSFISFYERIRRKNKSA